MWSDGNDDDDDDKSKENRDHTMYENLMRQANVMKGTRAKWAISNCIKTHQQSDKLNDQNTR